MPSEAPKLSAFMGARHLCTGSGQPGTASGPQLTVPPSQASQPCTVIMLHHFRDDSSDIPNILPQF